MSPYYEHGGITIYHGDCREIELNGIGRIDLVCTDPPYGISLANNDVDGHRRVGSFGIMGDQDVTWIAPWLWAQSGDCPLVVFVRKCLKRTWELIQVSGNDNLPDPRGESVWRYPMTPADTIQHIAAKPLELIVRLI